MIKYLFILISVVFISYGKADCFDDKLTHPEITRVSIKNSNINSYLIGSLGFSDGTSQKITTYLSPTSRTVLEWLRTGSTDEDSPTCRAANHFHDPLKAWTDSYVTDSPAVIQAWCRDAPPVWPTYSNITWATGYEVRDKKLASSMDRQEMNWDNAHSNFYSALMATNTPNNRRLT